MKPENTGRYEAKEKSLEAKQTGGSGRERRDFHLEGPPQGDSTGERLLRDTNDGAETFNGTKTIASENTQRKYGKGGFGEARSTGVFSRHTPCGLTSGDSAGVKRAGRPSPSIKSGCSHLIDRQKRAGESAGQM